jgi:GTP-binding protein
MNASNFPLVALIGAPNTGKSTLLNKIAGKHLAITANMAGTTRDRQYVDTFWDGVGFTLVDTAGLDLAGEGELEENIQKQIEVAVKEAQVLIMVADGKQPARALDASVLKHFRKTDKPIILAVNKLDSPKFETALAEFQVLGIKPLVAVSAVTGRGIGDLLDLVVKQLPQSPSEQPLPSGPAVALVGKPNVGKSSIFNRLLSEERVVVSATPGTTRTSIDTLLKFEGEDYTLIDTAGLKKKEHKQTQADLYSGFQTFKSIRRSDVVLFVVDSVEQVTKQDKQIAQEIIQMEKGCVILVNKMDIYDSEEKKLRDYVSFHFPFLWMCPIFFVSGKTGSNLKEALRAVKPIVENRQKEISAEDLENFLQRKLKQNPPKLLRDQKQPKVFSLTQIGHTPPAFELLVNHPATISSQFRHFLQNAIIKELGFWGTPVRLNLLGKDKT